MIKYFTIYGERCSGTNYLNNIINLNFDIEITWKYGWKHFYGFDDLSNSDDTLFICITRNPYDWMNSLYANPHHLCYDVRKNIQNFLNNIIFSFNDSNNNDESKEIMEDRNIYTSERYKNIFDLRHNKIKYLVETLPLLVKNYILIRYEDLLYNFEEQMNRFLFFNLPIKNNIIFPLNEKFDFKHGNVYDKKKYNFINNNIINKHKDFIKQFEIELKYYDFSNNEFEEQVEEEIFINNEAEKPLEEKNAINNEMETPLEEETVINNEELPI